MWVINETRCKPCKLLPPHAQLCCLMIRCICRSKNRLIGIHFAELIHNKMSDTEEVMDEEVQYVLIFILLHFHILIRKIMLFSKLFIFFLYYSYSFGQYCCSSEGRKKVRKLHLPMFLQNKISFPVISIFSNHLCSWSSAQEEATGEGALFSFFFKIYTIYTYRSVYSAIFFSSSQMSQSRSRSKCLSSS